MLPSRQVVLDQSPSSSVLWFGESRRCLIDADRVFDDLFGRYEQPICTYLARLTGSLAQAEELTQETFLRAYRALVRGERWENPRAWLYRVASRLAVDVARRRRVLRWLPFSGQEADKGPGPEATVERIAAQAALEALPQRYRIPLVLHVQAGLKVAEVAQVLGLSESAVKMRLCQAREMFRAAWREEDG